MKRSITTFRKPIFSIWQHALHQAIAQKNPNARQDLSASQPEMVQFNDALSALLGGQAIPELDSLGNIIGSCAKLAAELAWAEITRDTLRASELQEELQYGTCDPLWSIALAIYLAWKASSAPVPYVRYTDLGDFVIP